VNIAVDSTCKIFSNDKVQLKYQKQRSHCQKKNTKSSKRKQAEKRNFRTDINHCVSKNLVEKTKDTNVGIALEDLSGITKRTTIRKAQ
jgi:hypothetical protein